MPDKTYDVLIDIRTQAAGVEAATAQVKQLKADMEALRIAQDQAATAALHPAPVITDTTVLQLATAEQAAAEAKSAILTAQLQSRAALNTATAETVAIETQSVATEELSAAAQAKINLQMERRVIMETELEAAEARIARNPALALRLERESEIRIRALAVQQALNVSTEESIVLAERLVIAEEAAAVATDAMGVNMAKAKTEALVLGREMAAGNVRASTMSSLLGSLGTVFTVAGIAAYELFHFIANQVEETKKLNDEYKKITAELGHVSTAWETAASHATTFSDTVKLAERIKQDLTRMQADMAAFRTRELPLWQRFWDDIATHNDNAFDVNGVLGKPNQGGRGPFDTERQKKAMDEQNRQLEEANRQLDLAEQNTKDWDAAELDLTKGLSAYTEKLTIAEAKLKELNVLRKADPTDPNILQSYTEQVGLVNDLKDKVNQLGDEQDKVNKKNNLDALRSERDLRKEVRDLIKETTAAVSDVKNDPFLLIGEKNAELIPLLQAEAQAHLAAGDAAKAHALEMEKLSLTFSGTFRTNITSWVNSFGTVATQLASTITGVLNTAISGTAQAITGLLFHTQTLGQAARSVFQSLVQQVIQWGIQMLITATLGRLLRNQSTQEQAAANAQIVASATPAAVAQSGATSGSNWIIGAIAAGVAIAAIIALLAGGFESGGPTFGREGKFAGIVHGEEHVQPAPIVRRYGVDLFEAFRLGKISVDDARALMNGLRIPVSPRFGSFEDGGPVAALSSSNGLSFSTNDGAAGGVSPSIGDIKVTILNDMDSLRREILKNDDATHIIINGLNGKSHLVRKHS